MGWVAKSKIQAVDQDREECRDRCAGSSLQNFELC